MTDDSSASGRPAPAVDPESAPFWDGTVEGVLRLQRCRDCGAAQHFPRWSCIRCHSTGLDPFDASGLGTVYSKTVIRQHHMEPYRSWLPYVVALVDLDEGPRMMSNIVGCDPQQVQVGMRVRVLFDPVSPQAAVPLFEPVQ